MHRIDRPARGPADGRIAQRAAASLVPCVMTGLAAPADAAPVITLGVDDFVDDVLTQRIAFAAPSVLEGAVAGRYVAPGGSIAAGSATFDDGVLRGDAPASLVSTMRSPGASAMRAGREARRQMRSHTPRAAVSRSHVGTRRPESSRVAGVGRRP